MTSPWHARPRYATGLRHGPRRQVASEGFVPEAAQIRHAQIQDHLPGFVAPAHARALEALREHGLARRLRHAAANRQTPLPVARVIHPAAVPAQVAIRLPEG